MGSLTERRRGNGSIAYRAAVVIHRDAKRHAIAQTFDREQAGKQWIAGKARSSYSAGSSAPPRWHQRTAVISTDMGAKVRLQSARPSLADHVISPDRPAEKDRRPDLDRWIGGKRRCRDKASLEGLRRSLKEEAPYLHSWKIRSGEWITLSKHRRPEAAHGLQMALAVYIIRIETQKQGQ